ncbi:MAG: translation elongation factor Ts [Alphaproteobacteria bacterium]
MTTVTAAMVKELRDRTGAGMGDCKSALVETGGDQEAAIDLLRKKGLAKAAKKSGRTAADGLIGVAVAGHEGAMVEINAETDFVARNETFQTAVKTVALVALTTNGDIAKVAQAPYPGESVSVAEHLTNLVAKIGENISLRRTVKLEVESGLVASYVHNAVTTDLGRIGVLVALESKADKTKLADLGKKLAMHIASGFPAVALGITEKDIPADLVARERKIFQEQAQEGGKPANVIEKMVEGRMRKFYEEVVLLKQIYVHDQDKKVEQVLADAGKEFGTPVTIKAFERFVVGEGIDKAKEDFAAEVAAAMKG